MQGKVEICGVNTSKLRTLKNDEMVELLHKCKQGDANARKQLIEGNLRLVLSVIQRFAGRGENADDLFQVGCIGLLKAVENFDETKDVRFSTYGVPMIAGEIRRYLRDNSAIRVSRSVRDTAYKVLQCKESLMRELGREPSICEISEHLEIAYDEIVDAMDAVAVPLSLHDPIFPDDSDPITVMDQVGDPKNTDEQWMEHIAIKDAISKLADRERNILALRFYDGKTQVEVAQEIGISQAQVSRLEKSALHSIKKAILPT